jgi:hypothetical protein
MASTRSNAPTRRAASSALAETPAAPFLTLLRRGAHLQIAAWTAASGAFTRRTQSADRLAQSIGGELLLCVNGESDSAQLAARLTEASSTHLRELTALPRAAARHFDARLARVPTNT